MKFYRELLVMGLLMVSAQNFGPVVGTYEGHLPLSEYRES